MGQRITPEMFRRDPNYWFDVSHPRRVDRAILLLSGLSYGFGEHAEALATDELQMKFISEAFLNWEEPRSPVPSLLRDARLGTDNLGSFFGEERSKILSPLLGSEASTPFTRESLKTMADKSLAAMSKSEDDYSGWALLHAVIGDYPPYGDSLHHLKGILRETDYISLFRMDTGSGALAMFFGSSQCMNLLDEKLREHLKGQLVGIAKCFGDAQSSKQVNDNQGKIGKITLEERPALLLEWALNICLGHEPTGGIVAEFAKLVTNLVDVAPSIGPLIRPIIQILLEELPTPEAKHLWALMIRLRAEKHEEAA
ncbi:MAG: hypothetical protein IH955_04285 [Chloroflexi bacterium]|nr:hypothetical protein [Chloroflexota bacterium]